MTGTLGDRPGDSTETAAQRWGARLVRSVQASRRSRAIPLMVRGIWFLIVASLLQRRVLRGFSPDIRTADGLVLPGGPARSNMNAMVLLRGVHEPALTQLLDEQIAPGDVCIDVGANAGWFALRMGRRSGAEGRVVAVEAVRGNVEAMRANLAANGLVDVVEVVHAAVADAPGTVTFHVHDSNDMLCRLELPGRQDPEYWALHHWMKPSRWSPEPVMADTLVGLVGLELAAATRVLKIDVEGLEAAVCAGLLDVFTHPDLLVAIEVLPRSASAIADEFEPHGFVAYDIHNDYRWVLRDDPPEPPSRLTWAEVRNGRQPRDLVLTRRPLDERRGPRRQSRVDAAAS